MMFKRQEIEQRERDTLAPYGLKAGDSKGRVYPEQEPRYRTAFQRDRDRVLHTTAFRRLEYKTQVFVNHEGDYFRTRLTHTLEVAQIGRTIARQLGANEDLVETICLVHDIGHPPFGHSGEHVLNALMSQHGAGYDHNQQTLRIVTKLEARYDEFPGLNLTYETREGIVKHETEYDVATIGAAYEPAKLGSLEAQIANAADELSYTAHDLDDGLYARLIHPQQLTDIRLWNDVRDQLGITSPYVDEMTRHRIIRRLVGVMVRDVCEATNGRIEAANPQSVEDLQALPNNVIGLSDEMAGMVRELKDFLFQNMYYHYRVVRMAQKAERLITELFNAYYEEPKQLPTSTQARLKESDISLARVICDYIAGMTDRYAQQEHDKLFSTHMRT